MDGARLLPFASWPSEPVHVTLNWPLAGLEVVFENLTRTGRGARSRPGPGGRQLRLACGVRQQRCIEHHTHPPTGHRRTRPEWPGASRSVVKGHSKGQRTPRARRRDVRTAQATRQGQAGQGPACPSAGPAGSCACTAATTRGVPRSRCGHGSCAASCSGPSSPPRPTSPSASLCGAILIAAPLLGFLGLASSKQHDGGIDWSDDRMGGRQPRITGPEFQGSLPIIGVIGQLPDVTAASTRTPTRWSRSRREP